MKLASRLFLLISLFAPFQIANSITVGVNGDWSCSMTDTITNSGDYYGTSFESDAAQLGCSPTSTLLSISAATSSSTPWTLYVKLNTTISGLSVNLKRTGNGTGDSTPSGGDNYITLTTSEQVFFTGEGNISSIPLLFELNNLDVSDGYGNKNIEISYRVVE